MEKKRDGVRKKRGKKMRKKRRGKKFRRNRSRYREKI